MIEVLKGQRISLRPAVETDRLNVYHWLAHSDNTPTMMGPPEFPDHPVPTWQEFCHDYQPHYFDDSHSHLGRCFIINNGIEDIGVVAYNAIDMKSRRTDVDIWMRSQADTCKGYGTDALIVLAKYLFERMNVREIVIAPSSRNERAIRAYCKAGFQPAHRKDYDELVPHDQRDYADVTILRLRPDGS